MVQQASWPMVLINDSKGVRLGTKERAESVTGGGEGSLLNLVGLPSGWAELHLSIFSWKDKPALLNLFRPPTV